MEATLDSHKPIKPKLEEFDLTIEMVKNLEHFKAKCKAKSDRCHNIVFIICLIILLIFLIINKLSLIFLIAGGIFAAIITWGIIPILFTTITKYDLKDYIYNKTKDTTIYQSDKNNKQYLAALSEYKEKNNFYERVMCRVAWQYWLSLTPTDFEEAVGDLFLDKGYEVWTTRATGDHGVDLFLEKDSKKYVVQCKTYKKVLGPNAARDLYGTMTAQHADGAFLAAPSGFSYATKEFCKDKPIKLLDIDDLTQMTYDFESYTPYWMANAKSKEDLLKGINKNILGKPYRRRSY